MVSLGDFDLRQFFHLIMLILMFDFAYGDGYHHCTALLDLTVKNGVCSPMQHGKGLKSNCHPAPSCKQTFNITSIQMKAYSAEIMTDLLTTCCGPCVGKTRITKIQRLSELTQELMNSSDFIFPVLGRQTTTSLYGQYFIPLIRTPHVFFISVRKITQIKDLMTSCFMNLWPPMTLLFLMVFISGFICWAVETRHNKGQFPRPFLEGWVEGIWWSFITMTTVGYGDKAPKSILGRVVTTIWIFVGMSVFTLLTALFSAEIYMMYTEPTPKMAEKRVGVIHHHVYETMLISRNDGMVVDVLQPNMTEGIHALVSLLKRKEIDGFVFDKYELMLFYKFFNEDERYKGDVKYLRENAIFTEVTYSEKLLYGVLVKNEREYRFLRDFMISNREVIDNCNALQIQNYSRITIVPEYHTLFFAGGEKFWPSFNVCMIVLAIILVIGCVYELQRKKRSFESKACDKNDEHHLVLWTNRYLKEAFCQEKEKMRNHFIQAKLSENELP